MWVPILLDIPFIGEGSEFIDNLLQKIWMSLYQGLWDTTNRLFNFIQGVLSNEITRSRNLVSQSPQQWNGEAFSFIQEVAQNAAIPIAGCILTFIFCWQLISMMQESNHLQNIKPETIVFLLMKLCICLLVCNRSFRIINGLFQLANWGVNHIPFQLTSDSGTLTLDSLLPREQAEYTFGLVGEMLVNLLITFLAMLVTYVIGVGIYLRVNVWYLELLIYASAAPIPFSTFINKEWGQVGQNYLRKMLAMAFEGFFMIIAFSLYGALVTHAMTSSAGNSYLMSMVVSCGCGVAILMIISKAGSISSSVFNAH